jgi:preprotein translocase subunit YajC
VSLEYFSFQQTGPKAGTPGTSADGAAPQGGGAPPGGGLLTMLLTFLIFVPILFLMFRRQKKEAAARASLKKGDRVVSNSGLVGELMDLDDKFAKVKIAPGTTVTMVASTVAPLTPETQPAAKTELKDAKAVSDKK